MTYDPYGNHPQHHNPGMPQIQISVTPGLPWNPPFVPRVLCAPGDESQVRAVTGTVMAYLEANVNRQPHLQNFYLLVTQQGRTWSTNEFADAVTMAYAYLFDIIMSQGQQAASDRFTDSVEWVISSLAYKEAERRSDLLQFIRQNPDWSADMNNILGYWRDTLGNIQRAKNHLMQINRQGGNGGYGGGRDPGAIGGNGGYGGGGYGGYGGNAYGGNAYGGNHGGNGNYYGGGQNTYGGNGYNGYPPANQYNGYPPATQVGYDRPLAGSTTSTGGGNPAWQVDSLGINDMARTDVDDNPSH